MAPDGSASNRAICFALLKLSSLPPKGDYCTERGSRRINARTISSNLEKTYLILLVAITWRVGAGLFVGFPPPCQTGRDAKGLLRDHSRSDIASESDWMRFPARYLQN